MGYFTKDTAPVPPAARLEPLTRDRVKAALDRAGWTTEIDEDGDIGGGWEFGVFFFLVQGQSDEFFCVRGYWRGRLEESEQLRAMELCNRWNSEMIWPKTYAVPDSEGFIRLNVEHNVDYEHGLTDDQLDQHLLCAVNTGMSFFERANEVFPEVWEAYRPDA